MTVEIKKHNLEHFFNLKIGDELSYAGHYVTGFQSGVSKIQSIYRETTYADGVKSDYSEAVMARLENEKLVLIGFFNKNIFEINKTFENEQKIVLNVTVCHKPTKKSFTVKKVRENGKIELQDGTVISREEFNLNWKYE